MNDLERLKEANMIWKSHLFQEEIAEAKKEMYAECIEKIKLKDYQGAAALNAACEALDTFSERFKDMSGLGTEELSQDEDL